MRHSLTALLATYAIAMVMAGLDAWAKVLTT
jgi:hypothetical protein